jgi:PAS domain S-box-containing protein
MTLLSRKILIIDDSPEDRAEMRRMLLAGSKTRYRFIEAELGAVGLRLCRDAKDGLPDVVLLDFSLPDMIATDLLAELCKGADLPPCPVVVLTGLDQQSGPELLRAGAQDFLGKSWTTAESLTRAVENSIERFALLAARKHAAEQLRAAHDSFRHLVEQSPFGIYAVDADFRLVQVSVGAQKVFENVRPLIGRDFAEVLREVWSEPFASDAIAIFRQVLASGEAFHAPTTVEKRQNITAVEAYDWKVERIILPDGRPGAVCHFYDLSERQRYEAELREQEHRLRSLLENSPLAVIEWNSDHLVTRWAGEAEATYGWSAAEVVGLPIAELGMIYEEDRPIVERVIARLTDGVTRHLTQGLRLQTKDRRVVHCVWHHSVLADAAGKVISVLALGVDVTAQKEAEAELLLRTTELRESERRVRLAAEASAVGIWEWDVGTDAIRWDAQMFHLYGIAPTPDGFVRYSDWSGAVLPEDLPESERVLQDTLRRSGQSRREFRILRRNDGQCRNIESVATARTDEHGQARWVLGTSLDITERKRAEEKVRVAKEAAETASAVKDRFLAMLSHELRTPLTPVLMTLEMLEQDPKLSVEVREDFAMMKRNVELEAKLIDDLLDLNRIASGKLPLTIAPVDLRATIRNACEICGPSARERGIRIETEFDPATGLVAGDAVRLRQVLWNVLSNAIKFTPENGVIRVMTRRLDDARCEVRVGDSGIGIAPEMLTRIFDAFEQGGTIVTRQFGGLGLGLAICKALVELHQGSIRAESDGAGKGATFVIELPSAASPMKATDAVGLTAGTPDSRQLRLLVVEDHADTAHTLARLLRGAGFAVSVAADVASALAAIERESFDVLISDLGLPDGSGNDVMRALRARGAVPGIAMSGYGMEDDLRRSREAGFSEHLVKPIALGKLKEAIRRVTENRGE